MTTGSLLAIAIKKARHEPMTTVSEATITKEEGLEGDVRGTIGRRQVTVVAREAWQRACQALGEEVSWTARRANLLVEGFDLENSLGRVLQIGPVRLQVTGETVACARMDQSHPGLREALEPEWRGGVITSVLAPGKIRPGDPVVWDGPDHT